MMTRSLRNNNPGNIRVGANWRGLMKPTDMTTPQEAEHEFCVFQSPAWGFRAMAVILMNDGKDGRDTIEKIIRRWAPPNENNTLRYENAVSHFTDYGVQVHLNLHDAETLRRLCKAIASVEAGTTLAWKDADIVEGVRMALA